MPKRERRNSDVDVLKVRLQHVQMAAQRLADDVKQMLNDRPFTKPFIENLPGIDNPE